MKRTVLSIMVMMIAMVLLLGACTPNTPPEATPTVTVEAVPTPEVTPEPEETPIPEETPDPNAEQASADVASHYTLTVNDNAILTVEDLILGDYSVFAAADAMIEAMGAPVSDEDYGEDASGKTMRFLEYDGLLLMFTGDELTDVICELPDIAGPRGLRVGMGIQQVLDAFRVEVIAMETAADEAQESIVLYREKAAVVEMEDGTTEVLGSFPPYGEMSKDDAEYDFNYIQYMTPLDYHEGYYDERVYEMDTDYLYDSQCLLNIIVEGGAVTRWSWSVSFGEE